MKKFIYTTLLLVCMHNIVAMDSEQPKPPESGFSLLQLRTSLGNWLETGLDTVEQAFTLEANPAHQLDSDAQALAEELQFKPLSQIVTDTIKADNQKKFFSLLAGMKHLNMRPTEETETIIQRHLNVLHLENRQISKGVLESRMTEERALHQLRKQYKAPADQLSDDEDYTDSTRFARKLLSEN